MVSSDDEDDVVPVAVSDYHFVDANDEIISFSGLPVQWSENERSDGVKGVFLNGTTDNGLQKLYKQVIAWKYDLSKAKPEISVLSKENRWIKLLKPRKSFEETIRTILISVHCLHFARKKPDASKKALWDHLSNVFSLYEPRPSENDLIDHFDFIGEAVRRDDILKTSKFVVAFLEEKPRKMNLEDAKVSANSGFIVDDVPMDEAEDDDSDEESDVFDSVCAICDNGGDLLCCEGKCLRSFHTTEEAGSESSCISLGLSEQVEEIQTFFCENCLYNKHQCFVCGELGSSDKSSCPEVFRCSSATCGYFYHPECVAKLLHREGADKLQVLTEKIASGEPFTCPAHKCCICKQGENEKEHDLQFATCRRCPKSYHRKCLPRDIVFDSSEDDGTIARAWENLLPKSRILLYCLEHEIDDELETPKRDHIKFPYLDLNKKRRSSEQLANRRRAATNDQKQTSECKSVLTSEIVGNKVYASKRRSRMSSVVEPSKKQNVADTPKKQLKKALSTKVEKCAKEGSKASWYDLMLGAENDRKPKKDSAPVAEEEQITSPKSFVKQNHSLPVLDCDSERRLLDMIKIAHSSITMEEVIEEHKALSTQAYSSRNIVDRITLGKVEGSVEALRVALKKLDEKCSVEDAKAVCEPGVINQINKWREKLRVYLAPFLMGMRYTSFGRHFTKVERLEKIVDRLRWYVEDGDMIVDFCCGANDFSCILKKRLDEMGKKCSFKNYDLVQAKSDFNFEKRNWMTVEPKELPPGKKLIMGLNPPFGVKACLANQFIDKALTFKPKLLILIVPPETQRLDEKDKGPSYNLIWEDRKLLEGKAFYLPGSIDIADKQLDDWNNTTPPLYLWSHPDWTNMYKAIAEKQGHISPGKSGLHSGSEIPMLSDDPPVKNEVPVNIEEKAPATVSGTHKGGLAHNNGDTKAKENKFGQGKNKSGENSKKKDFGKRKRGRDSDAVKLSGKKSKEWKSPPPRSQAPEMPPHNADLGKEDGKLLDLPVSKSYPYHGRPREDDAAMRHNKNMDESPHYARPDVRPDVPSLAPDYGYRTLEVEYPSYQREAAEHRSYSSRPYGENTSAKYGMESLSQRGNYGGGYDPTFSSAYMKPSLAAEPPSYGRIIAEPSSYDRIIAEPSSYDRINAPTTQRYMPRLDELNPIRMNSMGPGSEPSYMSGGGFYDHSVPRPGVQRDSLGFASGPYRPSHNTSAGWLNE